MWIKVSEDFWLSSDQLESIYFHGEKGVTYLYPVGMAAALARGESPPAFMVFGDVVDLIIEEVGKGSYRLDISRRDIEAPPPPSPPPA
jgi:hypothetical protein